MMELWTGPVVEPQVLPEGLAGYRAAVESRPLLVSAALVEEVHNLHRLLLRGLRGLLLDPATPEAVGLTPAVRAHLELCRGLPLSLGALRPDLLIDRAGRPRICEINARFPVNGFLATAYLSRHFGQAYPHLRSIPGHDKILEHLRVPASTVVVKGREAGWDIHQLCLQSGCSILSLDQAGDLPESVILELHQDELLQWRGLPDLMGRRYFNDIRCIWLAHDKRLLALLGDAPLMERWLGKEAALLAEAVVPTLPLQSGWLPGDWVLKPNCLGKGQGMVFRHQVSEPAWQAALSRAPAQWVVQPRIECLQLDLEGIAHSVVGTTLSMNDEVFGLGLVRVAQGILVNVSGGGRVLCPMIS